MVVLYASDPRVTVFAQEVLEKFLKHGIDVAVQKHLIEQNKFSSSPLALKKKDVRTEHLAEIICSSHADFLIVLGDRNMKNKSCQAKRKGKLMEMKVIDMISLIWKSWPQNPQKTLTRIQNLTQPQTETLLLQYCGLRHASNRVQYLETLISEFKKIVNGVLDQSLYDEETNQKLANVEKCCVRLHKQLKKCFTCLSEVPVQTDNQASRGCIMSLDYKPNSSRSPRNSISLILQKYLQKVVYLMMKSTEEVVLQLSPLLLPNWEEYIKPHLETFSVDLASLELVVETPPLVTTTTSDDDDSSSDETQSNCSDGDVANLADLEIDDDLFGDAHPTDEEESESMSSTGLTTPIMTKARSVSSPSRMSTQSRPYFGNVGLWGNSENSGEFVARRVSEPALPVCEFNQYSSSLEDETERKRTPWLAPTETVWYNAGGMEEILTRESPRDFNTIEKRTVAMPPLSTASLENISVSSDRIPNFSHGLSGTRISQSKSPRASFDEDTSSRESQDNVCQFYFSDLVTSPSPTSQVNYPVHATSPRSLNPYASYSQMGQDPAEPPGFAPSSWPLSSSWQNPTYQSSNQLSPFSSGYKSPISSSGTISAPSAGVGSSMSLGARDVSRIGNRTATSAATISSKTQKSTLSPQKNFNATIGAHLQERQSKTNSVFELSSPLSSPFTSESEIAEIPPASSASFSSNFSPFQSTTSKAPSLKQTYSEGQIPDTFSEFSGGLGYGDKSTRSSSPPLPQPTPKSLPFRPMSHKLQVPPQTSKPLRQSSNPKKIQPDYMAQNLTTGFEAISPIWGDDDNALFGAPQWPWGAAVGNESIPGLGTGFESYGSRQSNTTEVTVRGSSGSNSDRQKFSSSY